MTVKLTRNTDRTAFLSTKNQVQVQGHSPLDIHSILHDNDEYADRTLSDPQQQEQQHSPPLDVINHP